MSNNNLVGTIPYQLPPNVHLLYVLYLSQLLTFHFILFILFNNLHSFYAEILLIITSLAHSLTLFLTSPLSQTCMLLSSFKLILLVPIKHFHFHSFYVGISITISSSKHSMSTFKICLPSPNCEISSNHSRWMSS